MRARKRTERYVRNRSPLFGLRGTGELAQALGLTRDELDALKGAGAQYGEWDEPKASGGLRRIENPPRSLKQVQRRVGRLLMRIEPPKLLFCPVAGRSAVQCAKVHLGAKQVWSIDIKDYFPNTSRERIFRFFKNDMACAGDIAGILTDIVSYKGHLPQGAPSSPVVAYFANSHVWAEVERLCEAAGCRATLWIDDLTVSGNRVPKALQWQIASVLRRARLWYHKEKFGHDKPLKLTGIMVSHDDWALPNSYFRDLRALRRAIRNSAPEDRPSLNASLLGKLRYGAAVRQAAASPLEIQPAGRPEGVKDGPAGHRLRRREASLTPSPPDLATLIQEMKG